MNIRIAVGVTLALVAGCGKKKGEASGGNSAFSAWTQPDTAKLWEGPWLVRMNLESNKKGYTSMAGDIVAIDVKGDKATAFGGEKDQELGFALDSPCGARFSEPITEGSMKGGTSYNTINFIVEKGVLAIGSGAAGYRKGKAAIVCASGDVTTLDDKGTCQAWKKRFDKWESESSTCEWSQKDGKDVLTVGTGNWKTTVEADGDLLKSERFGNKDRKEDFARTKDFAEAKAKVTADIKANDPGEQAKAKGGVAGKTDTVLSLIATFASDKTLRGKTIELTAQYLNSNSSTSNGKTTHNVMLVDGKDQADLAIPCELGETAPPDGLTQYDKVTVKGTVNESFGKPDLENCTVAKAP